MDNKIYNNDRQKEKDISNKIQHMVAKCNMNMLQCYSK